MRDKHLLIIGWIVACIVVAVIIIIIASNSSNRAGMALANQCTGRLGGTCMDDSNCGGDGKCQCVGVDKTVPKYGTCRLKAAGATVN